MDDDLFIPDKNVMVNNPGQVSAEEAAKMLHDMYKALVGAGFNKSQALVILCQMVGASNKQGVM